ncbi:MAG: Xaa-Pro dipeptidase [Planctomycetes bacterium]|nr:Xaa-Pro dipeptidase [Planctomycetota bacterium]
MSAPPEWSSLDHAALYAAHLETSLAATREALSAGPWAGVVFHAGEESYYHADDMPPPFHAVAHFTRFAPVVGPEHLLLVPRQGEARLLRVDPKDFWHEPPVASPTWFAGLEVDSVDTPHLARKQARELVADLSGWVYVGNSASAAEALGIPAANREPAALVRRLDWARGFKTPYEAACLREACRRASVGHHAVRQGAREQRSEHALHLSYLEATGLLEREVPYQNIIAWNEHSAVLHYGSKSRETPKPGYTLLIDAGATCNGYASDITRTHLREGSHAVFHEAWLGMIRLQDTLVDQVRPGLSYVALHEAAFRGVTELLCVLGVLQVSPDEAFERRYAFPFFPHGLGHHLGIQVHDVGGKQLGPDQGASAPPKDFPWLRTVRPLAEDHVVTIEPGLYFIPLLLNGFREGPEAAAFNWSLIDSLVPSGGIRIEDDVLVTATGRENLSRPYLPTQS